MKTNLLYLVLICWLTVRLAGLEALASDQEAPTLREEAQAVSSAEKFYVKVTIQVPAPRRGGRVANSGARIVSGASGIIVDSSGHVVTAAHIAKRTDFEALVTTLDGHQYPGRILLIEPNMDLALLKIAPKRRHFTTATPAARIETGQQVLAIGAPGSTPGVAASGRVVRPKSPGRFRYGDYGFENPIELALTIEPGYSGGPVVNMTGQLVGMIVGFDLRRDRFGEYSRTGTAYAVSVSEVMRFVYRALEME